MNLEQVRRDYEQEHCPDGAEIQWDGHGTPWIHDGRGMPFPMRNSWDRWLAATRAALGWASEACRERQRDSLKHTKRRDECQSLADYFGKAVAALGGDE